MESAIAMKPVFISVLTKSLSKPILNRIKLTWKNLCEKLNKEVDDDKNNDITDEKLKTFQLSISTVSTWDESEKENYTMEILTTIFHFYILK